MTMITLDDQIAQEVKLLSDTRDALSKLREDIEELREKLACGDSSDATTANTEIKRLTGLFNTCLETENRLEKCRNLKAGIAQNGVAFDLDAARDSIGCKLDSLRRCCGHDLVSG